MYRGKNLVLILIMVLILAALSGCGKKVLPPATEVPQTPSVTEDNKPEAEQPEITKGISILTGLPMENSKVNLRPIAVMIDNEVSARPQSGLNSADIIYEMPVEGNITRYMAIYQSGISEKIGPVRSARSYFLDKSMEFNAVYVHCGGSPQALKDIDSLKIDTLNDLKGANCFWRANDRKMPHNLYTSTKLMREVMAAKRLEKEVQLPKFNFSQNFIDIDGKIVNEFTINYFSDYKIGYEYKENEKIYYRKVNGLYHKDKETGIPITAINIIIEKVPFKVIDKAGRLESDNLGKGRGYFITGGKLIEIEWYKDKRDKRTVYKDLKGNELIFNKGNTWVQVVQDSAKINLGD